MFYRLLRGNNMNQSFKRIGLGVLVTVMCLSPVYAKKQSRTLSHKYKSFTQFDDRVVARLDGKDVITMRQLAHYIQVRRVLGVLNVNSLKDALNQYIDLRLMESFAQQTGLVVRPEEVMQLAQSIAASNGVSVQQLAAQLKSKGLGWQSYLQYLKEEKIYKDIQGGLYNQEVPVTEHDIDVFLKQYPKGLMKTHYKPIKQTFVQPVFVPKVAALKDILVSISSGASASEVDSARQKANYIHQQLRSGVPFEQVAKQFSDGQTAQQGGDLGIRLLTDWPAVFVRSIKGVPQGGITRVFKAPNGFHILKVMEYRGVVEQRKQVVVISPEQQMSPMERMILSGKTINGTDVNTRHILVKFTPIMNNTKAKAKINEAYQQLKSGEDFEKVAEKYSDDASAVDGGNLGWMNVSSLDSNYAAQATNLPLNTISKPFRTQFGWHVVEVLDRKTKDYTEQVYRNTARQSLIQQRGEAVFRDWLSTLRSQHYIKIDLPK